VKTIDKLADSANPLEAFELEAQALAPSRRAGPALAVSPMPSMTPGRGPATVHDLTAAAEARVIKHVSKEAAETRRRLTELKQALEAAITRQSVDLNRLTWTLRIAIYILLAISLSQIGFIVWTKR
jgi:hypothetical protein